MRHVMVVANETLVGAHVTKRIFELNEVEPLDLFVVVPATPHADDESIERAGANLEAGLEAFRRLGIEASGRVGQADPLAAIRYSLETHPAINLIVLSTLPVGRSRWLNLDLPHRLRRRYKVAVEHIVGTPVDAHPDAHVQDQPVKVLLVEDDAHDIELAQLALEATGSNVEVLISRTGAHAVQYMAEASPKPDLILADIKMPVMDGFEMLEQFASKLGLDSLNELNVVVLTSSSAESDRDRAHALGAQAYVVKSPDFDDFQATIKSLVREVVEHQVARR